MSTIVKNQVQLSILSISFVQPFSYFGKASICKKRLAIKNITDETLSKTTLCEDSYLHSNITQCFYLYQCSKLTKRSFALLSRGREKTLGTRLLFLLLHRSVMRLSQIEKLSMVASWVSVWNQSSGDSASSVLVRNNSWENAHRPQVHFHETKLIPTWKVLYGDFWNRMHMVNSEMAWYLDKEGRRESKWGPRLWTTRNSVWLMAEVPQSLFTLKDWEFSTHANRRTDETRLSFSLHDCKHFIYCYSAKLNYKLLNYLKIIITLTSWDVHRDLFFLVDMNQLNSYNKRITIKSW